MFEALEVAVQFVEAVVPAAEIVARHDKDLASQLRRAANSAAHNTAEGNKRRGGDRLHSFRIASGEASEALTALRLAVAWRYIAADTVAPARALEDRLQAMLWRLQHPR
jgi:four helix bundle protein